MNVQRHDYQIWGNVLRDPTNAVRIGGTIDSSVTDPGSSDSHVIRAGMIFAKKTSNGKFYPYGINFTLVSDEDVGAGDGATVVFSLDHQHVVPYSETIEVDGSELTRDEDYTIDYKTGVVTFKTAPASGAAITATYLYDDTLDGTEIPVGVLENYAYLTDLTGTPVDTNAQFIISGWVDESKLIAYQDRALAFAKHYFATHGFLGITDPEVSL